MDKGHALTCPLFGGSTVFGFECFIVETTAVVEEPSKGIEMIIEYRVYIIIGLLMHVRIWPHQETDWNHCGKCRGWCCNSLGDCVADIRIVQVYRVMCQKKNRLKLKCV